MARRSLSETPRSAGGSIPRPQRSPRPSAQRATRRAIPQRPPPSSSVAVLPRAASFVGRDAELRGLDDLFADEDVRCVTLKGPAGIGKTTLALEWAARTRDKAAFDSVWFCELEAAADVDSSLVVVALALDLPEPLERDVGDRIRRIGRAHA